jgi:hypothetical protein
VARRWCGSLATHAVHEWGYRNGDTRENVCLGVQTVGLEIGHPVTHEARRQLAQYEAEGDLFTARSHEAPVSNGGNMTTEPGAEGLKPSSSGWTACGTCGDERFPAWNHESRTLHCEGCYAEYSGRLELVVEGHVVPEERGDVLRREDVLTVIEDYERRCAPFGERRVACAALASLVEKLPTTSGSER